MSEIYLCFRSALFRMLCHEVLKSLGGYLPPNVAVYMSPRRFAVRRYWPGGGATLKVIEP